MDGGKKRRKKESYGMDGGKKRMKKEKESCGMDGGRGEERREAMNGRKEDNKDERVFTVLIVDG